VDIVSPKTMDYPKYWTKDFKNERIPVIPGSDEWTSIAALVEGSRVPHPSFANLKSMKITNILRVENAELWSKYYSFSESIRTRSGTPVTPIKLTYSKAIDSSINEFYLLHGTSKYVIDNNITKVGFDEKMARKGGFFGAGIYLSENSSKANLYVPCPKCGCFTEASTIICVCENSESVEYCMMVCRVLLGDTYICNKYSEIEMRGTPKNPVSKAPFKPNSTQRYDSIIGMGKVDGDKRSLNYYREYVIYDGRQAYPEYLIFYTREQGWAQLDQTGTNAPLKFNPTTINQFIDNIQKQSASNWVEEEDVNGRQYLTEGPPMKL